MTRSTARERLTHAAFELFDEQGYEQTTVDDIAERAGVGRTTLFRSFQSKEELIFPDHSRILRLVTERLAAATTGNGMLAVREATHTVLRQYLDEGDRARIRYRLISTIPVLRARETASAQQYQRAFRRFIYTQLPDAPAAELRAEIMGAGVVAAHNHVLRRWLREVSTDPELELDDALNHVVNMFRGSSATPERTSVIVLQTTSDLDNLLPSLRAALDSAPLLD